jgi:hypothetical protein
MIEDNKDFQPIQEDANEYLSSYIRPKEKEKK